ncbi:hypothetical protein Emed_000761 [Eimeria media]
MSTLNGRGTLCLYRLKLTLLVFDASGRHPTIGTLPSEGVEGLGAAAAAAAVAELPVHLKKEGGLNSSSSSSNNSSNSSNSTRIILLYFSSSSGGNTRRFGETMLWVDKHAPRRIDDLDCHENLTPLLRSLASSDSPPHLLFYGPSGGGKKTRALALLRELFGEEVDRVRVETFVEKESNAEATVCQSSCHVILSCNEFGFRDRAIVQAIIKSLVEAAPQAALASSFFTKAKQQKRFKVVVLQDADVLTEGAQHALRRSLETHVSSLKFLLLNSRSSAIECSINSGSSTTRSSSNSSNSSNNSNSSSNSTDDVSAAAAPHAAASVVAAAAPPSAAAVAAAASAVAAAVVAAFAAAAPACAVAAAASASAAALLLLLLQAELTPEAMLRQVCLFSGRNLRRSLLSLQCILTQNFAAASSSSQQQQQQHQLQQQLLVYGHPNSPFPAPWEAVADEIAAKIAKAPSVRTLQECRGCFYELLAALIPADIILLRIIRSLFFVKPGSPPPDTSQTLSNSSSSNSNNAAAAAAAAAKFKQHRRRRLLLREAVDDAALAAQGFQRGSKPIFHLEAFAASGVHSISRRCPAAAQAVINDSAAAAPKAAAAARQNAAAATASTAAAAAALPLQTLQGPYDAAS